MVDYGMMANGFVLGAIGQGIRVAIGVSKWLTDKERTDVFDWKITATSLVLGGLAGAVAGLIPAVGPLGVVCAGYAGAHALEGTLASYLPGQR